MFLRLRVKLILQWRGTEGGGILCTKKGERKRKKQERRKMNVTQCQEENIVQLYKYCAKQSEGKDSKREREKTTKHCVYEWERPKNKRKREKNKIKNEERKTPERGENNEKQQTESVICTGLERKSNGEAEERGREKKRMNDHWKAGLKNSRDQNCNKRKNSTQNLWRFQEIGDEREERKK